MANELEIDGLIGQTLNGNYKVLHKVGFGAMGAIFEVQHTRLPKRFAIKVFPPELRKVPTLWKRFQEEANITSSLGHRNIIQVSDFNEESGYSYMVMELLVGINLQERLDQLGAQLMPLDEVVLIAEQVVSALEATHAQGIIHRDMKPSNIFLHEDSQGTVVKVLDFGISKLLNPNGESKAGPALTSQSGFIGTPYYASPEQILGRVITCASDIFSLGACLYEMLTGNTAFHGQDAQEIIGMVLTEDPPPPSENGGRSSEELDGVVMRALAKKPENRFGSVRELFIALQEAAESVEGTGVYLPGDLGFKNTHLMAGSIFLDGGEDGPTTESEVPVDDDTLQEEIPTREITPAGTELGNGPILPPSDPPAPSTPPAKPARPAKATMFQTMFARPKRSTVVAMVAGILGVSVVGVVLWLMGISELFEQAKEDGLAKVKAAQAAKAKTAKTDSTLADSPDAGMVEVQSLLPDTGSSIPDGALVQTDSLVTVDIRPDTATKSKPDTRTLQKPVHHRPPRTKKQPRPRPQKGFGKLRIGAMVGTEGKMGVRIYLNRKFQGTTPVFLKKVPAGVHRVKGVIGPREKTQRVRVKPGKTQSVILKF